MPAGCGWPSVLAADLPRLARDFAGRTQRILNTTICRDIRIPAVVYDRDVVLVGYGLGKSSLRTARFPVLSRRCWLDIGYRLCLDQEGQYLAVAASAFSVFAADDDGSCLCRFDYERGKQSYPEAHLQVYGDSSALAIWGGKTRTRQLDRLHFPVGGRRYRPILEDVIELLITEELAIPRDEGWREVLRAERELFQQIQLKAAIRRDPETARAALRDLGLL
jgi:hypothetical protein